MDVESIAMAGADKAARWLPVVLSGVYAALALPAAIEHTMPAPVALISVLFAAVLIALSIVDLKSLRLPDVLTLPLIASALCWLASSIGTVSPGGSFRPASGSVRPMVSRAFTSICVDKADLGSAMPNYLQRRAPGSARVVLRRCCSMPV